MPIAVVTGANKGIGRSIVQQLALRYPTSPLYARCLAPLLIYLTSRNTAQGVYAVQHLQEESQLRDAKALQADGGLSQIAHETLDVTSTQSIQAFVAKMRERHGSTGGIDVLVNNAGIALDGFDYETADRTLATNYYGTVALTQAFLPDLLKPHARIVNVSSMLGKLPKYSTELKAAFLAAADRDAHASKASDPSHDPTAATTQVMQRFMHAMSESEGTAALQGWPRSAYAVSKSGVTGVTFAVAAHETARRPADARLVNCCCPGYVNTDLTHGRGRKTAEKGADTPAFLALEDVGGVTGEFWENREVKSWT